MITYSSFTLRYLLCIQVEYYRICLSTLTILLLKPMRIISRKRDENEKLTMNISSGKELMFVFIFKKIDNKTGAAVI